MSRGSAGDYQSDERAGVAQRQRSRCLVADLVLSADACQYRFDIQRGLPFPIVELLFPPSALLWKGRHLAGEPRLCTVESVLHFRPFQDKR